MKRLNIGIFVENRVREYTLNLAEGARAAIEEAGHNCVYISEAIQDPFDTESSQYIVSYNIAKALDLDAYIVPIGIFNSYRSYAKVGAIEFAKMLPREKTLIIEDKIDEFKSFYKDNKPGMREIICHLIEHHKYKKIGFISGPENSFGALERESVYFEEMERHGLKIENRWFARSMFSGANTEDFERYLDLNPDVEAIACANDQMAVTLYGVMHARGLEPGKDIAVTGFDDIPTAALLDPPLTTIKIDSYEFGYSSGIEAIRIAKGEERRKLNISGHFIHRNSCGEPNMTEADIYHLFIAQGVMNKSKILRRINERSVLSYGKKPPIEFSDQIETFIDNCEYLVKDDLLDYNLIDFKDYRRFFESKDNPLYIEGFHQTINSLLSALADSVKDAQKLIVFKTLNDFNLEISRYYYTYYTDTNSSTLRQQSATLDITRFSLLNTTQMNTYSSILNGLKNASFNNAAILLYPEAIEITDQFSGELPNQMHIKGYLHDGVIHTNKEAGPLISLSHLTRNLFPAQRRVSNISIIPLYEEHQLRGVFIADTTHMSHDNFYFATLQINFALQHLSVVENEQRLIRILNHTNKELTIQSRYDSLTGLLNRRGFTQLVKINLADNKGKTGIVFYYDLDDFKNINDTFGHDEGDRAIKSMANILQKSFREDDLITRMGGDEFVIFIATDNLDAIIQMDMRIKENMDWFNRTNTKDYTLSTSVGYHAFTITENIDIDKMINIADQVLYKEKKKKKEKKEY